MELVKQQLNGDIDFLTKGCEEANESYNEILDKGNATEKKKMESAWNAVEFSELLKKAIGLITDLGTFIEMQKNGATFDMAKLKLNVMKYHKDVMLKKRVAAKYLMVFMIADELRNKKPYAIPVQFLPYKSITDSKLLELVYKLQDEMEKIGMTVVGTCYNSLSSSYASKNLFAMFLFY